MTTTTKRSASAESTDCRRCDYYSLSPSGGRPWCAAYEALLYRLTGCPTYAGPHEDDARREG